MDKKFNIVAQESIKKKERLFKKYLRVFLLDTESWELLEIISSQTQVYIFSGVIRNFLLDYHDNRDLDIVIKNIDQITIPSKYLRKLSIKRNSFGGFKLKIERIIVDAWGLDKTWGLINKNLEGTPENLIKTAFFNFSSIVFDFNKCKFIYGKDFLEFYITHIMDVVFERNPNVPLCIINSLYYSYKYSFPIKYNLCKWIYMNHSNTYDYNYTQIKHYNKIIFKAKSIQRFVYYCKFFVQNTKDYNGSLYINYDNFIDS